MELRGSFCQKQSQKLSLWGLEGSPIMTSMVRFSLSETPYQVFLREVFKKNAYKAVRLTAWVDPPLPRSGQENVKIFRQVVIFGVILPFYKG